MRSSKSGSLLIACGVVSIISALILTLYNVELQSRAAGMSDEIMSRLQFEDDFSDEDDFIGLPSYVKNPDMDMPESKVGNSSYIGVLSIPVLNIELPVNTKWSYPDLRKSPCRYSGSAYKDNMILCAHNYDSHFGGLKTLCVGDEISFVDIDDNVFLYEVVKTEILQPYDMEKLESGEWDLTLFTCTLGGKTRVTIRCNRLE